MKTNWQTQRIWFNLQLTITTDNGLMDITKKIRIGDLLVQNQIITQEQLISALAEQKKTGRQLAAS